MNTQLLPASAKRIWFISLMVLVSGFGNFAHAQADRIGSGGDWNEADLKHFLSKLIPYLISDEGQKLFPEVVEYNRTHVGKTVENVAAEVSPRLVSQAVYDSKGNERDCVSYEKPVRYFECNLKTLPPKPAEDALHEQKSEYYGSLYRLVLHEVFVQVELEKPLSKEVPSDYALSSRLMVHLEEFPEWVPGAAPINSSNKTDIVIHNSAEWAISLGAGSAAGSSFSRAYDDFYFVSNPSIFHVAATLKCRLPVTIGEKSYKFGLSTGFEYGFANLGDWVTPTMLNIERDFHEFHKIRPYLGFAIGLALTHYHNTSNYYYSGSWLTTKTFTDASLGAYIPIKFTPGFYFGERDRYFFEIPVEYHNKKISVLPSLGITL